MDIITLARQSTFMLRNIFGMPWKVWILSHPGSYKSQRQHNMSFILTVTCICIKMLLQNDNATVLPCLGFCFVFLFCCFPFWCNFLARSKAQSRTGSSSAWDSFLRHLQKLRLNPLSFSHISKDKTVKKNNKPRLSNHFLKSGLSLSNGTLTLQPWQWQPQ